MPQKSETLTTPALERLLPLSIPISTQFNEVLTKMECSLKARFENLPYDTQEVVVFRRVQQILGTLLTNQVWRERLTRAGVTTLPHNWEEWQAVPLTDRETLQAFYGGVGERPGLVKPYQQGGFQITTSGGTSSGQPIETVYTPTELRATYARAGQFIGRYIVDPIMERSSGERPYTVFTPLNDSGMWSSGTLIGGILSQIPDASFIPAGPLETTVLQYMMGFHGSKVMVGLPRELYKLAEQMQEADENLRRSLRVALYGGGVVLNHRRDQFRRTFPNSQILSFYSSTQALAMALQTDESESTLRTIPGLHLLEAVDPDTGRHVTPGQEAELVVTRLQADGAPIVRMRIGDLVTLTPPEANDPLQAQHIEFGGRSGDIIHIGESHYSATALYRSVYTQLKARGIDLSILGGEVQFDIDQANAFLRLKIAVAPESCDNLNFVLSASAQRSLMIDGLIQAIPLVDNDPGHIESLHKTDWKLEITFVSSDQVFISSRGKVPLVRTFTRRQ